MIGSAADLGNALSSLDKHDTAKFISRKGEQEFDLTTEWPADAISDLAVKETITTPAAPMILAVKRPDYLGSAQWEFRHGKRTIRARIEDEEWLSDFQGRHIDVRPGDALKCDVEVELAYGYDNELVTEKYTVKRVTAILEDEFKQTGFFDGDAT